MRRSVPSPLSSRRIRAGFLAVVGLLLAWAGWLVLAPIGGRPAPRAVAPDTGDTVETVNAGEVSNVRRLPRTAASVQRSVRRWRRNCRAWSDAHYGDMYRHLQTAIDPANGFPLPDAARLRLQQARDGVIDDALRLADTIIDRARQRARDGEWRDAVHELDAALLAVG